MDPMVWIDCEMTGLDLGVDRLLEVACLVTDDELNVLGEGVDLVLAAPEEALGAMLPVVAQMHDDSGLTDAVRQSTMTLAEAEEKVMAYVRAHVPEARKAPLCGNSIATDRGFLARDMPGLDAYLHYRMVDVSSVKELARRWYPRVYFASPEKNGGHRALADIRESVRELRYYRETLFVPQPGPSTEAARAVAERLAAASGGAAGVPAAAPVSTSGAASGAVRGSVPGAVPGDVPGAPPAEKPAEPPTATA